VLLVVKFAPEEAGSFLLLSTEPFAI
jgi:hypothetical protein